jgi:hypothetical protein
MKQMILCATLLLSACVSAPPAKVDQHFLIWQNKNINDMVLHYGAPGSQRAMDGKHYAEWTRQDTSSSPSFSIGIGGFGRNIGGSVGTTLAGGTQLNHCTVQAVYGDDGVIVHIAWNGDTDLCIKQFPAPK